LSFDENTQTINVGSRDWLEASKDMQIHAYVPPTPTLAASGPEVFVLTQEDFEEVLDKVSARGKYRDVPLSSEDFIAQKREEVKLEDGSLP
jgi:uncharacterized protein YcgL (UPF0745 family)